MRPGVRYIGTQGVMSARGESVRSIETVCSATGSTLAGSGRAGLTRTRVGRRRSAGAGSAGVLFAAAI